MFIGRLGKCSIIKKKSRRNIIYISCDYYRRTLYPWVICSKTYHGYMKPGIIPNAIYNVIFM